MLRRWVGSPNAAEAWPDPAARLAASVAAVVVSSLEEGVHVDLRIVVEYGTNIATVSRNLIDQVSFALKEYARAAGRCGCSRHGCQGAPLRLIARWAQVPA